jgi:hypothetical protein
LSQLDELDFNGLDLDSWILYSYKVY